MRYRAHHRCAAIPPSPAVIDRVARKLRGGTGSAASGRSLRLMCVTMAIAVLVGLRASADEADSMVLSDRSIDGPTVGSDWPLVMPYRGGEIRLYHPAVESLRGNRITSRAAFSVTAAPDATPAFGVLWLTGHAVIDRDTRTMTVSDQSATKAHLPAASAHDEALITSVVTGRIKGLDPVLSLDRILTSLNDAQRNQHAAATRTATPPAIIVVEHRAMLLTIDGDTHMDPIPGSRLDRIVNTPYPLVRDPSTAACWLLYGGRWYTAPVVTGPWTAAAEVTDEVLSLAPMLTGVASTADVHATAGPVDIVVSQHPAELISIDGAPTYDPIPGTALLAVTNTDSDLFVDTANQQHYALLDGRWFHTGDLAHGTWMQVAHAALVSSPWDYSPGALAEPDVDIATIRLPASGPSQRFGVDVVDNARFGQEPFP